MTCVVTSNTDLNTKSKHPDKKITTTLHILTTNKTLKSERSKPWRKPKGQDRRAPGSEGTEREFGVSSKREVRRCMTKRSQWPLHPRLSLHLLALWLLAGGPRSQKMLRRNLPLLGAASGSNRLWINEEKERDTYTGSSLQI